MPRDSETAATVSPRLRRLGLLSIFHPKLSASSEPRVHCRRRGNVSRDCALRAAFRGIEFIWRLGLVLVSGTPPTQRLFCLTREFISQ